MDAPDHEGRTVAITGASGFVGRSLAACLRAGGHRVLELVRREVRGDDEVQWDPRAGTVDDARLEGLQALVHLAGEPILGLRWSRAKRSRIASSRVLGTRAIVAAIARLEDPPGVLVAASAIGIYGDRGDAVLDEDATAGTGFLAETCAAWEAETDRVRSDVRAVKMRLGVVLDANGGALKMMLPAFKAGFGGRLASGQQWFPWVALDDAVGALQHAIQDESLRGAVNLVAPGEVRNAEFTRTLARSLRRPALIPVPRFVLRLALGKEQADEMLVSSVRVRPAALQQSGFEFRYPGLVDALGLALGSPR